MTLRADPLLHTWPATLAAVPRYYCGQCRPLLPGDSCVFPLALFCRWHSLLPLPFAQITAMRTSRTTRWVLLRAPRSLLFRASASSARAPPPRERLHRASASTARARCSLRRSSALCSD